jgi:hypothetical protein
MKRRAALQQLAMCLQGRLPAAPDWMSILDLANRSLMTAQLCAAISSADRANAIPEDVSKFLKEVRARNRMRNQRLMAQLCDALRALNGAGIQPVLLKGAAIWASMPHAQFDRILTDIDLLVRPDQVDRAISALEQAGFPVAARYPGHDVHVVAELGRPTDVGFIDLHQRPPGPPGLAQIADLERHCTPVTFERFVAQRPESAVQIFFLVLHDQFHDGDYWRGGVDVRHVMDIALLSTMSPAVDWKLLERLCGTQLVRNALETQLIAAQRLAGAVIPGHLTQRWWTNAHHRRHLWQFAHPRLMLPLAILGVISEWRRLLAHRVENRAGRYRVLGAPASGDDTSKRVKRFKRILSSPPGKL